MKSEPQTVSTYFRPKEIAPPAEYTIRTSQSGVCRCLPAKRQTHFLRVCHHLALGPPGDANQVQGARSYARWVIVLPIGSTEVAIKAHQPCLPPLPRRLETESLSSGPS